MNVCFMVTPVHAITGPGLLPSNFQVHGPWLSSCVVHDACRDSGNAEGDIIE